MDNAQDWMYLGWIICQSLCLILLLVMQSKIRKGKTPSKIVHMLCIALCAAAAIIAVGILL